MKGFVRFSLIAIFLGIHPTSCNKHGGHECNPESKLHFISSLSLDPKDISKEESLEYPYNAPALNSNPFYPKDSICLLLWVDKTHVVKNFHLENNLSFQNVAYACSPLYLYQNPIKDVNFIYQGPQMQVNSSTTIRQGDTISSLFRFTSTYSAIEPPKNLSEIKNFNNVHADFLIQFKEPNVDSLYLKFNAKIDLQDGTAYSFENLVFNLLPD